MPLLQSQLIMTAPYSKGRKNQPTRLLDLVSKVFLTPADVFLRIHITETYTETMKMSKQTTAC